MSIPDSAPDVTQHFHRVLTTTVVCLDRRVHGTDNLIGGTAAYKYAMDVLWTLHCEACCCDGKGAWPCRDGVSGRQRTQYSRADRTAWWRTILAAASAHESCARHQSRD